MLCSFLQKHIYTCAFRSDSYNIRKREFLYASLYGTVLRTIVWGGYIHHCVGQLYAPLFGAVIYTIV